MWDSFGRQMVSISHAHLTLVFWERRGYSHDYSLFQFTWDLWQPLHTEWKRREYYAEEYC
jgi:hypothetical protein